MENTSFMRVEEVAQELGVSKSYAYKIVQKLNEELPVPYLFQARGLPRYGFCALEMPLNSFDSHLPVCGLLLPPALLISSA